MSVQLLFTFCLLSTIHIGYCYYGMTSIGNVTIPSQLDRRTLLIPKRDGLYYAVHPLGLAWWYMMTLGPIKTQGKTFIVPPNSMLDYAALVSNTTMAKLRELEPNYAKHLTPPEKIYEPRLVITSTLTDIRMESFSPTICEQCQIFPQWELVFVYCLPIVTQDLRMSKCPAQNSPSMYARHDGYCLKVEVKDLLPSINGYWMIPQATFFPCESIDMDVKYIPITDNYASNFFSAMMLGNQSMIYQMGENIRLLVIHTSGLREEITGNRTIGRLDIPVSSHVYLYNITSREYSPVFGSQIVDSDIFMIDNTKLLEALLDYVLTETNVAITSVVGFIKNVLEYRYAILMTIVMMVLLMIILYLVHVCNIPVGMLCKCLSCIIPSRWRYSDLPYYN